MKKITSVYLILMLLSLCGCGINTQNSDTRFVLDTVATITANSNKKTISGAFELCSEYEKLLGKTSQSGDVYRLNNSKGYCDVSEETFKIIERSLYFSQISNGKFDITIYPVSVLWDFKNQVVPSKDEISEALKNVDYQSIQLKDGRVNLNGKKIDLGGIAKGYIADKVTEYLKENGAKKGIVNLGGNVVVFGKEYKVGIQNPFADGVIATLCLKDKTAVTSGIYQRFIEKDGKKYHHIIDTTTGYGVENELASVTVVGNSSLDCDALSTICMLAGLEQGLEIIDSMPETEAVFIEKSEKITLSKGLCEKKGAIYFK